MKRKHTNRILVISVFAALATLGSAQLRGAASAAGRASAPAMPTMRPPSPPPAAINTSSSAASSAAMRAPGVPANTNAAANANTHASPSTGLNANATSHASATGQVKGLTVASVASNQTSATVGTAETVQAIKDAAFAMRDTVSAGVQARLDASDREVTELRAKADASGDKARNDFAKSMIALRAQEKELRANLKASVKADGEAAWGKAQAALAHDYAAYAQALAEAHAAAEGSAKTDPAPKS